MSLVVRTSRPLSLVHIKTATPQPAIHPSRMQVPCKYLVILIRADRTALAGVACSSVYSCSNESGPPHQLRRSPRELDNTLAGPGLRRTVRPPHASPTDSNSASAYSLYSYCLFSGLLTFMPQSGERTRLRCRQRGAHRQDRIFDSILASRPSYVGPAALIC